jgi:hypothetical protein
LSLRKGEVYGTEAYVNNVAIIPKGLSAGAVKKKKKKEKEKEKKKGRGRQKSGT